MGDVRRPVLLDLFCGAGGCSVGYHRAGFDVVGVDLHPQPNYPFRFVQADALDYLREHGGRFDAIHASPPCQAYCTMNNRHGSASPPLIPDTLALLAASGRQWVLENVAGAKSALAREWTVRLTGEMFGNRLRPRSTGNWTVAVCGLARTGPNTGPFGRSRKGGPPSASTGWSGTNCGKPSRPPLRSSWAGNCSPWWDGMTS
jgi:hypothetical protein